MNKMTRKVFVSMIPVQILIALLPVVNGVVDGLIGARLLGSDVMSVTGLFDPINCIATAILSLFSIGTGIVNGILIGKGEVERASLCFSMALTVLSVIGILCSIALTLFSGPFAHMLYKSDVTTKLADYMRGIGPGYLFYMICPVLVTHLQLCGRGRMINYGVILMAYTNAFFDLIFISSFNMGIYGLGLATAIANIFQTVFMLVLFFGKDSLIRFRFGRVAKEDIRDVWKFGYPRLIFFGAVGLKALLCNRIMLRLNGSAGMAAVTLEILIMGILESIANGVGGAVMAMASVAYGEEDKEEFKGILILGLQWGLALAVFGAGFFILLHNSISMLYFSNNPEVQKIAAEMEIIFPGYIVISVITTILNSALQVLGKSKFISFSYFIEQFIALEFTYVFSRLWNIRGYWIVMPALKAVCLLITIAYLLILWVGNMKRNIPVGIIPFPEGFGYDADNRITAICKSKEDIIDVSEKMRVFCIEKGLGQKNANRVALCIEEMGRNIVKYGFPKKRNPAIVITLGYKNGELNMVIKDNCRHFNPEEWYKIHFPEEPEANLGIRMVKGVSNEFKYKSSFGLNSLNIRIHTAKKTA